MATIENTITPDSTLEKTNKRISGFDINSTLHEATQNRFKLCNGEEKDNTPSIITIPNSVSLRPYKKSKLNAYSFISFVTI